MKRAFVILSVTVATWLVSGRLIADSLWSAVLGSDFNPLETPLWLMNIYVVLQVGIPTVIAACVARLLVKRWVAPVSRPWVARLKRLALAPVVCGYWLTASFGIPATDEFLNEGVQGEYRFEKAVEPHFPYKRTDASHPRRRLYATIPVAPGVIIVYHEYIAGGLNGGGLFYLFVWNGMSITQLGIFSRWWA